MPFFFSLSSAQHACLQVNSTAIVLGYLLHLLFSVFFFFWIMKVLFSDGSHAMVGYSYTMCVSAQQCMPSPLDGWKGDREGKGKFTLNVLFWY